MKTRMGRGVCSSGRHHCSKSVRWASRSRHRRRGTKARPATALSHQATGPPRAGSTTRPGTTTGSCSPRLCSASRPTHSPRPPPFGRPEIPRAKARLGPCIARAPLATSRSRRPIRADTRFPIRRKSRPSDPQVHQGLRARAGKGQAMKRIGLLGGTSCKSSIDNYHFGKAMVRDGRRSRSAERRGQPTRRNGPVKNRPTRLKNPPSRLKKRPSRLKKRPKNTTRSSQRKRTDCKLESDCRGGPWAAPLVIAPETRLGFARGLCSCQTGCPQRTDTGRSRCR
jgi:hypothetical protein